MPSMTEDVAPPCGSIVRWSAEKAREWSQNIGWVVGANYIPSDAINQLEMWQEDTFNVALIDYELGLAHGIGLNAVRVYLHDLLWGADSEGFVRRIDQFLAVAARHQLRVIFVLLDSWGTPAPRLGPQHPPIPGVHNSGWAQSPGTRLQEPEVELSLRDYVQGVVARFSRDQRVLAWDVWNEPDIVHSARKQGDLVNKHELSAALLPRLFEWCRAASPSQPLTTAIWGDWRNLDGLSPVAKLSLAYSDITTFHNYEWPEHFEAKLRLLLTLGRPVLCTECVARPMGSTFEGILPVAKRYGVGAISWGLVRGKTQTHLPWDSWRRPYVTETPPVWLHDIFDTDGSPYRTAEIDLIRQLSGATAILKG